jgi:hypothetical protein
MVGADDGNRTRTISLGICIFWRRIQPDLRRDGSGSDRETPLISGVNGPLMARHSLSGAQALARSVLVEEVFVDALDHVGVLVLHAYVVLDHQSAQGLAVD